MHMPREKKNVLIIEDDAFSVKAYQLRLEKEDMHVRIATTGTEAMMLLNETPPNIVLLDLMLPGVSGFTILEAMRKLPEWKHVPVVIVSNLGQPEDIKQATDLGADSYVVKANARVDDIVDVIKKYSS